MRQRIRSHLTYANRAATIVGLTVLLTSAAVALVVLDDGPALAAKQPSCGDTITTDTTLHHNLTDCPNNGIIIGADNITLDLNHHTIDGDGTPAANCDPETEICDQGVWDDGYDGLTVVNGSVREFAGVGLNLGPGRHIRVLGVSSSKNGFFGFVLFDVAGGLVQNSSGNFNLAPEGDGMGVFRSHHVRIVHNSFRHNPEPGIHVDLDSTDNLIRGNRFSGNPNVAISLKDSDRNRVRGNRFFRNGDGIVLDRGSDHNLIAKNRIAHAIQHPGRSDGQAIEVGPHSDHNLIARNSVRDTDGGGISLGFQHRALVGNLVRRNRIRGAGRDGVEVNAGAKHTLLRRNRTSHSKDDGFDVEGRTTKLTRNEALRNGDLGIEAVRGVIDGGGNRASGNGDLRQCTNIVCG